jgi:hypothetical protein
VEARRIVSLIPAHTPESLWLPIGLDGEILVINGLMLKVYTFFWNKCSIGKFHKGLVSRILRLVCV